MAPREQYRRFAIHALVALSSLSVVASPSANESEQANGVLEARILTTLRVKMSSEGISETSIKSTVCFSEPNGTVCPDAGNIAFKLSDANAIKVTCRPTIIGDEASRDIPRDCSGYRKRGFTQSGIYEVLPDQFLQEPIEVYCDMETDGGGWTVFQRRDDYGDELRQDFFLTWQHYKKGFGALCREFWLGNDNLFALTNQEQMTLRVDIGDFEGQRAFATYEDFLVRSERESYRAVVGRYCGDAGDSMSDDAHNSSFTTRDRDNDRHEMRNCADVRKGGWWYNACGDTNLNGMYLRGYYRSPLGDGLFWNNWRGSYYSLKFSEMKIRPKNFKDIRS